ncbi:MAG: tetratricopeptide repeat protein [Planctomycetaceae bacterium]|nr:tetratricopeptide repeat protein [Planctomycetaceae bacterium]
MRLYAIRSAKIRREAEGFLELGMPQHALQTLGRLGDPAGFGVETLYLWGEGLRTMRRYFEALMPLERAARLAPDDIRIRLALAWCYKRTGRLDLAIGSLEKALLVRPDEALLYYNLACYLSLAGHKRRSLRCLAKAMRLDPVYQDMVDEEADFDPLRADPDFQAIRAGAKAH